MLDGFCLGVNRNQKSLNQWTPQQIFSGSSKIKHFNESFLGEPKNGCDLWICFHRAGERRGGECKALHAHSWQAGGVECAGNQINKDCVLRLGPTKGTQEEEGPTNPFFVRYRAQQPAPFMHCFPKFLYDWYFV